MTNLPWSYVQIPGFAYKTVGYNLGCYTLGPWWGREEQTESVNLSLMIGTWVSHNSGIPVSKGNPVSCVQAGGNRNMSFALAS